MTQYRRKPDIDAAPLLDETVIYDQEGNRFCILNRTAAFLWDRLENPAVLDELETAMVHAFEGADRETVKADIEQAVRELQDLGLITANV